MIDNLAWKDVLLAQYHQNVQVKKDAMGRACSIHGEKRNA
jgi:hypothetical protein